MSSGIVFPPFESTPGWYAIRSYLFSGGVLGYPAEYAYALGEVPTRRPPGSIARLYRIKNRNPDKPVLYLAGNTKVLSRFAHLPKDLSKSAFLSGRPRFTTYILKATFLAMALGMARSGKVAFRIPTDPVLRDFLSYLDEPLSGTSLNLSGSEPLRNLDEIRGIFPDLAVVDGGFRPGFPVSPILELSRFDRRVLRGSWTRIRS